MTFEQHLQEPHARGPVPDGAHVGSAGGHVCGDLVRMAVLPAGGRIEEISFEAEGCGATLAAASACALLADGVTPIDAARIRSPPSSADSHRASGMPPTSPPMRCTARYRRPGPTRQSWPTLRPGGCSSR